MSALVSRLGPNSRGTAQWVDRPVHFSLGTGACAWRAGFGHWTTPETHVESELQFSWPGGSDALASDLPTETSRALARRRRGDASSAESGVVPIPNDEADLRQDLELARAAIAKLDADRKAARIRIEELEQTRDTLQTKLTAQRRRLLVLERQLEDAEVMPALEATNASWLERLFGGFTSATTG